MSNDKKIRVKMQKKIEADIKCIRKVDRQLSVNKIIKEIKAYYTDNKYDESILFYRIDSLETSNLYDDAEFGAIISAFIAFELLINVVDIMPLSNSILKIIVALMMIIVIMIVIRVFVKNYASSGRGRKRYINKKEIEIIEDIIENRSKKINATKYKNCKHKKEI